MKRGLIVYNAIDTKKNQWFIDKCLSFLNDDGHSLSYLEEKQLLDYVKKHNVDYVIYRGRDSRLLEQLENRGIKTFNNGTTNKIANDKWLTVKLLERLDLPHISSFLDSKNLSYPFIMKSISGHGGQEVFLIKNDNMQRQVLKQNPGKSFIYQDYLGNDGDVRLYVLDDKVIAAVKRVNADDYRNNFSLGGEVSIFEPNKAMIECAQLIAKELQSTFIGVDFLLTKDGFRIIEIEDPVGSRMLYQSSNIDIIKMYCEIIKEKI